MPRRAVLLLLLAIPLWARERMAGGPIELSHARYGTATGAPRLVANGGRLVLFWIADDKLYAAPLDPTRPRLGRAVFGALQSVGFDVAPVGEKFLVVGQIWNTIGPTSLAGQIVSLNGDPEGAPLTLRNGRWPHIALGHEMLFLVHGEGRNNDVESVGLSLDGRRVVAPEVYLGSSLYDAASVASSGKGFAVFAATAAGARVVLYDEIVQARMERSITSYAKDSAIAHNGRRYLAAWIERDRVRAAAIGDDGSVGTPITLATCGTSTLCQGPFANVSVVWDGMSWIAGVTETVFRRNVEYDAQLLRVDEEVTRVISSERIQGAWRSSVAVTEGAVTAAWSRGEFEPIRTKTGLVTAQQPAVDRIVATASAADSTLFVFVQTTAERARIMAGIRDRNGSWSEEEIRNIDTALTGATAGSDGREFLVAIRTASDSWLFRLDQDGRRIGEPLRLDDFEPHAIAWTGGEYVLSGGRRDGTAALLIGDRSVPLAIAGETTSSAIASDGDSAYALWIVQGRLYGTRIDRLGMLRDFGPVRPNAAPFLTWTGKQYVAVWPAPDRIRMAEISAAGAVLKTQSRAGTPYSFDVSVARAGQTIAIAFKEPLFDRNTGHVLFLDDDGGSWIQKLDRFGSLTPLPNGTLAVASPANRVTINILSFTLPPLPEAPRAFWMVEENRYTIAWQAVPQPVSGYRVEFRSRTEPWREIEAWFRPDERSATVTLPARDLPYMFRVRAINDRGMGPYGIATRRR